MSEQPARRYETVLLYRTGPAAKIVLNRPERLNAWSTVMSKDLISVLDEVGNDDSVRAVMLTGAGRAFCSGADLKNRGGSPGRDQPQTGAGSTLVEWYHPIVTAIRDMPKPVISAVNGAAAGAGASLALSADLVVAAESAYFLLAFANIGLVPDAGSSLFVSARVGFTRAAELAMLAERLPAARAAEIGLANAAWPDDEFEKKAEGLLLRLSNGPTQSYAGIKRELNAWMYGRMADQLELEATIQQEMGRTRDFTEGVTAFLEKRLARFTGA
ncbi:MAG TPA: enoyl-CoA hydratase-related protein [Trebonia sp.]|nr:enoyl-CoA hydratase-related protein [Trebonia sp.]